MAKEKNSDNPTENNQGSETKVPPAVQELVNSVKQQSEQIKELTEKLATAEKKAQAAEEAAEQRKLEKDKDLQALLKDLNDEEEPPSGARKKPELDEMTNSELMDLISGAVETFVGTTVKEQEKLQKDTSEKLMEQILNTQKALGMLLAQNNVSQLQTRYPDFDEFRERISQIMEETPGLKIEQAYRLAKAEELEKHPAPQITETEFPDHTFAPTGLPIVPRRKEEQQRQRGEETGPAGAPRRGAQRFRSIFDAGYERAMANRRR